jgi:hypothetical protein
MGVDIQLFISHRWEVRDVQDVLESLYGKVGYSASHTPDMAILDFKYSADEPRSMYVHINSEMAGFRGMFLRFRATYGHSKEIMEAIAKRLGGFLNYEDVNDDYVAFPMCGQGNLDFHVKHAITHGETDGENLQEFAEKAIAFSNKLHDSQEKNTKRFFDSLQKQKGKV